MTRMAEQSRSNSPAATSGRDAALRRIAARARRFPRFDPMTAGSSNWTHDLPSREVSLALAIDHAAARHWLTLVHLLEPLLRQPWDQLEAPLQAALIGGAAQLIYLDSVPDHAAISETVQWAKTKIRPGAGKLTNAILRRLADTQVETLATFDRASRCQIPLSDGRAVLFNRELFSEDPLTRVAEQTGHHAWIVRRWAQQHGRDVAVDIALHNLVHPPTIITGPADQLPPVRTTEPHDEPGFHIVSPGGLVDAAPLSGESQWRIQDPGTARAMLMSQRVKPSLIIDYCAGRGTKTHQLLQMHSTATIFATDVNDARRSDLRTTFRGIDRVSVLEPDALRKHIGRADLLVLDVPCSNSGVLGRRVEARYRVTEAALSDLIDIQRQVIADALPLLGPAGHLLYATCSIDECENSEQARWINHWHRMPIEQEQTILPKGQPGDRQSAYSDGGYSALLAARIP